MLRDVTDIRANDRSSVRPLVDNAPFYLLIAGAFAFLTIPRMAQAGMFVDGVTYAAIAQNLAHGVGTFWSPTFTSTVYPQFHEHPPLGFALQGAMFAVFGDHLAVERVYSMVVGSLTALLITLIWRGTVGERQYDWLPLAFWLLPSTVTWAIANNLLENTQALFTTLAVFAFVRSLHSATRSVAWAALAGLSVVAATLTKGPTGFFPLAAPVMASVLLPGRASMALRSGAAMCAMVAVAAVLLLWSEAARAALSVHWNQQVVASISGVRGGGRWSSLARHLSGGVIIRMGVPLALAWLYARLRQRPSEGGEAVLYRWGWFFLILALAGSVPVAISARIAGHYLVPSIPLFSLGAASVSLALLEPALDQWRQRTSVRTVAASLGAVLIAGSVAWPAFGGSFERRDADWIREYRSLSSSVPRGVTMGTCEAVRADWRLHAYMQRFFVVALDPELEHRHRYFLQLTDRDCAPPPACRSVAATQRLVMLDCETAPDRESR
jgi:4-amino-4-deoxy-L-arabinose transferase-like glycosyltransferase